MGHKTIRIGAGCAWMGDRISPARRNAEEGRLDYLTFEAMAEVSIATAQLKKRREPNYPGYDLYLDDRMEAVLPGCLRNGTKLITNEGWVNPEGAAERIVWWLRKLGVRGKKVVAVTGSLITDRVLELTDTILENGRATSTLKDSMISAEAYMGAEPIVEALSRGADIVVTGRVADPSLFLAPMMYEFGWKADDYEHLGRGQGIGHVMECAAHASGGCFVDPGFKDLPDPWDIAFPIAEVRSDGSAVITKIDGTGGGVNLMTIKEQLLYEVHDPANYLTPDVIVDFSRTMLREVGPDRVEITGIRGKPRPPTLKVTIGCMEGYIGEDMVFTAGPGAFERAQLVRRVLEERFKVVGLEAEEIMIDFPGINAIHGDISPRPSPEPYEVILRVAARTKTREEAAKVGREVDAMAVSGPGMVGKRPPYQDRVREIIGVWSTLVPRDEIKPGFQIYES